MAEWGNKALGGRVMDAAITVHREPGPGFLESVDELALVHELTKRGIEPDFLISKFHVRRIQKI